MQLKSTLINGVGKTLDVVYNDINGEGDLGDKKIKGVHAYCFYKDKLIVVYGDSKGYWTPAGGGIELGESSHEAVVREVKEETNMKVLQYRFIGCQDITEADGSITSQTRSVCIVEPFGPFVSDPDGDITKIEFIDPADYKKYFDWGEIGDHIMARALELKKEIESSQN